MVRNLELIRNTDAGDLLETLFVSAITSVLVTRFFLYITNYPQLGGERFHIAHMLWGGLFMLVALVILLSFLGRRIRILGSLIGGIGFGLFIDELGKFITSDNNYFYEPAVALLYLIFLGLFFLFRYIESYKSLTQKEYLMNALLLLEEAILNDMDKTELEKYQKFLKNAENHHYLTKELQDLSIKLTIHAPKPSKIVKFIINLIGYFNTFVKSGLFQKLVIGVFLIHFLFAVITAILLIYFRLSNTPSIFNPIPERYIFVGWGEFISVLLSAVLSINGVIFLTFSKQKAYMFFKYSLLVSILLSSFFSFYRIQFYAIYGLFINILLLIGVNNMLGQLQIKKTLRA